MISFQRRSCTTIHADSTPILRSYPTVNPSTTLETSGSRDCLAVSVVLLLCKQNSCCVADTRGSELALRIASARNKLVGNRGGSTPWRVHSASMGGNPTPAGRPMPALCACPNVNMAMFEFSSDSLQVDCLSRPSWVL